MQPAIESQTEELTQASKLANSSISGIDTVKCCNGQWSERMQYFLSIRKAARYYLIQARANALQMGLVRLLMRAMFVQGFWYGSHIVENGKKSSGQILTAFWACIMATQSFEQILPQMIVLEKGRAAAATLQAILVKIDRGQRVSNVVGLKTPIFCEGDIILKEVR